MNPSPATVLAAILLWSLAASNIQARMPVPDSLQQAGYNSLQNNFFKNRHNKPQAAAYAHLWLSKAKKANNIAQQVQAYKALAYVHQGQKIQYVFLDSMVAIAKESRQDALIGQAYLSRGISLYQDFHHRQALDNYLWADAHILNTKNQYLIHKVKYQIAQTKYQLGFYDEAIALLLPCKTYFSTQNDRAYLNTIYALSLCYNGQGKFVQARNFIREGKDLCTIWQITELLPYFTLSESITDLGQKNYSAALSNASQAITALEDTSDPANLAMAHFVAGKSNWILQNKAAAIENFKKVHQIFSSKKYIRPELLQAYEYLVNYYKKQDKATQALYYADYFLQAEVKTMHEYRYLSSKILRKYNPRQLQKELQELKQNQTRTKQWGYSLISAMSLSLLLLIYRTKKQRAFYHQKFEELMKKNNLNTQKPIAKPIPYSQTELGFNEQLAQKLLKRLELFEARHEYIQPDMSLQKLADKLNTNQKYVTKLLSHYRGKGTIEYISDLKIDYILHKLQTDKKFRNYKNKSLGLEVGFGSTQIFTRSFKERVGMPPTVFISELNRLEQEKAQQPSVHNTSDKL